MYPAKVNAVLNHFYVDDSLLSVLQEDQAYRILNELTLLCASGGFCLTKWKSNNRAALSSITDSERERN